MWNELKKRLDSPDSYVSLVLGLAVVLVIGMLVVNYIKTKSQQAPVATEQTQEQKTVEEKIAALPTTHTVKEGETLWSIAEQYYTSGYNWIDLKEANSLVNANILFVGQTLTIPKKDPIVPAGNISAASTERDLTKKTYTVAKGDTLWDIATKQYGNGFKWSDIARANNLTHPNLIHPGNVLSLPE